MAFRILLIRKPQQRKDNLNGIRNRFVHVAKLVRYLDSSKYTATAGVFGVSKVIFTIVGVFIVAIAIVMFVIIGNASRKTTSSSGSKINNNYVNSNTNNDTENVTLESLGYVNAN